MIQEYQFQNLVTNRVPCIMLDFRIEEANKPRLNRANVVTADSYKKIIANSEKEQPIVVVCDDGKLSMWISERIAQMGFYNVVVLEGGVRSLSAACKIQIQV